MTKVLQVDQVGGGIIEKDLGANYSEVWVEIDVALSAAGLVDLLSNPSSFTDFALVQLSGVAGGNGCGAEWYVDSGPTIKWAAFTNLVDPASTPDAPASPITSLQFYRLKIHLTAGTPIAMTISVDGVDIGAVTVTSTSQAHIRAIQLFQFGDISSGSYVYFDTVKVGSTEGASDIFADDFEGGDTSHWTSVDPGFSVVDDPGIAAAVPGGGPPPPPPETAELVIRIYDLGTNVLADITLIALEKTLIRQVNGPRSFEVKTPESPLLAGIAADGFPNLYDGGNRKIVVWENSDPDTDDPIFHGRIYNVERDGSEDNREITITAYDPWMEIGYEADERAGRPVRDGTTTEVGDPSFLTPSFTSSVMGQDGLSGPDLIKQVLTYSQDDPTTNPIQGEGPLPIDLRSGEWDLDVPPAIDLNPRDSMDWPVLIGDLINQLIATNVVDFDLRPIRPGTGLNLAGDADDYIMVEASAKSKLGTDRSATVHFDYLTGSHNAKGARHVTDFSKHCDRLYYELGPRLNGSHWRGDLTPHSASTADVLAEADASAEKYGGPGEVPGRFVAFRVFDSLGTENSSRPLYVALYEAEVSMRVEPRRLLYVTPADGDKALFQPPHDYDAYDDVRIRTGPGLGVELDEVQKVYGYTKTWSREGVASVSELHTSAEATSSLGGGGSPSVLTADFSVA